MRLLFFLLLISTRAVHAQDTLDITKHLQCEVFPEKGKFNREERLEKIKEIGGQLVTVYVLKGKDNKIKDKYTGKVDLTLIDNSKLSLDIRTQVLVVTVDQGNGKMISHLVHTYEKNFRIYLTDCLGR